MDHEIFGYVEALLPLFCRRHGARLGQFLPEHIGFTSPDNESKVALLVLRDCVEGSAVVVEPLKLYHPIKG